MKVDQFDFDLPREAIALRPVSPRDAAKLLVVRGGALDDLKVTDLPGFLRPGDVMVFNDTKVIPARLSGHRHPAGVEGGAKVEITLHMRLDEKRWKAFARPAKKLKSGDEIKFAAGLAATVAEKGEAGEVTLEFNHAGDALRAALGQAGIMPLPPYIAGQRPADARDEADYQTVYAAREGAVAAPTAGLHFTPDLLAGLDSMGVTRVTVTLHVGAGTFLPVKVDDTADHKMHAEWGEISRHAAKAINAARAKGGRIVAVGTTSLRLLETAADDAGIVHPLAVETDIFITPGYRFKAVDMLMTNFHLPRSTLFMLVSAFAGLDRMRAAYAHAIKNGYRFYSYGDASLLYKAE
jgi:S-adenosylmethionine:tRNA ribosyltransferase-isomerase